VPCRARSVTHRGDFRILRAKGAYKRLYCGTTGSTRGRDSVTSIFRGSAVEVVRGTSPRGGRAVVLVDGKVRATLSFRAATTGPGARRLTFHHRTLLRGFGPGVHRIEVRRLSGPAYVEGFLRYQ
jgi:hypothetical protein